MSLFAAIDSSGQTQFIGEVLRGASCGCFCAECKSPVVAKQGRDHAWHFAHEASQERPQCLPGSINLLRRLAIQRVLGCFPLTLPECKQLVVPDWGYAGTHETAAWTLPACRLAETDALAAFGKPVARLNPIGMLECSIGLWVQVGELTAQSQAEFDGEVVYHCPVPPKGAITTQTSAVDFLERNSAWHWQKMPDALGTLAQARQRLQERLVAQQAEQVDKQQRLRSLQGTRSASWDEPSSLLPQLQPSAPLPVWVSLKKKHSSFFAYQMLAKDQFWIVMASADHDGYYIVPGAGWWDGWDESLPASVGQADLVKGAYRGNGRIDNAIACMQRLGVSASRIDSDPALICIFTGWKD